jgi:hypothetical protein
MWTCAGRHDRGGRRMGPRLTLWTGRVTYLVSIGTPWGRKAVCIAVSAGWGCALASQSRREEDRSLRLCAPALCRAAAAASRRRCAALGPCPSRHIGRPSGPPLPLRKALSPVSESRWSACAPSFRALSSVACRAQRACVLDRLKLPLDRRTGSSDFNADLRAVAAPKILLHGRKLGL